MPPAKASDLVERAEAASQEIARIAVTDVLNHLRSINQPAKAAWIPCGSRQVPNDLTAVLRSHPMIHTAEGALFQQAVTAACEASGLAVISAREREVWRNAAKAWKLEETELRRQIDGLRKSVGAPWGGDQKTAAAFAVLAP